MLGLIITIALHLQPVQEEIRYLVFKAEQRADHHVATDPKWPELDDLDILIDRKDRKENKIP